LVIGAIVVVVRERSTIEDAWRALQAAPPWTVVALLGSLLASVLLSGIVFWLLTNRFGRVPFGDMQALIAATALLNYLPLRPGLVGRVVYHRTHHGIRAQDSLRTIVEAMALSIVALGLLVPGLLIAHALTAPLWMAVIAPLLPCCAGLVWRGQRSLLLAYATRVVETILTAVRYHLLFALLGSPVPWHVSGSLACVSMIATMVPFVSNGLGLREWAIACLAPLLAGASLERGLAVELLHRTTEILVIAPTGLMGLFWLWRAQRRTHD
jgi:uncharacterized membrane protein YbhN (UPF0104 family)